MRDSNNNLYDVERRRVALSFDDAAKYYDTFSLLQQTVVDRLIESFDLIKITPATILDIGSGTGYGSRQLKQRFKKASFYQSDISGEMLKISRMRSPRYFSKNHFLCADAAQMPIQDQQFDLVFCSLMLQWCSDLELVFAEVKRMLKPGGVFLFASFGPDTLKELRECWQKVDDDIHVNAFVDMHDIGDSLIRNGMDAPVLSVEHIVLTYSDCKQLMYELKNIGAHNVNKGRRKTLTGKQRLNKVVSHYETFRSDNKLPATYEVVSGHAWRPHQEISSTDVNSQSISLEQLKQDLKTRKKK
ncbi:MAG: malonyl-[acyl-carrier protein] O-methyltransferase 1 [marine bacterium B5-7]|nr:MAG: malonyl-[acyl-carrier protein] O-methyltransferase 1 [marine bacterium B5-7]